MNDAVWLNSTALAQIVGVSAQAARRALRRAAAGERWRGHALMVRAVQAVGGRGAIAWEVDQRSLPPQALLQPSFERALPGIPISARDRKPSDATIAGRWPAVSEALGHPINSAARAAAIAAVAQRCRRSVRTIYRWIERYEAQGLRGLARARSAAAAMPRVVVSREFDRAFLATGYDETLLADVAATLQKSLKGLWASRAEHAGEREIRRLAEFLLLEACEARALTMSRASIRLTRSAVERFAQYRVVNRRRNDRKTFDDAKPRIRRDWTMLAPMERIVVDVKHLDVIVERDDGTPAWPKIVAFMDAGTGRVFVHPVLLERGEGICQEHVIEAFLMMVSDPHWGFPQGLYLDNGPELAGLTKIAATLDLINDAGARTVIFARPYNAAAKPIESLFARLDRYVFSLLPGYAGPDRIAKKTQTLGRPPKPYPGSWSAFCEKVGGLIAAHNNRPVGGQWQNRSPNSWFQDKADAGWRPVHVAPMILDTAFCDHDSRRVDRGVVRLHGERYTSIELQALPSRTIVDLALPWRRGVSPLCRTPDGRWSELKKEIPYPAAWREGAREASRRQKAQARYVDALACDAPRIDPVEVKLRWGKRQPPVEVCAPPTRIDAGEALASLADARVVTPGEAQSSAASARSARALEITERLERMFSKDG